MAGLAALLSFASDRTANQTLRALSDALAPRGDDMAAVEHGAARLLIRSALPKVFDLDGTAVIVDGIAEVSSLIARYGEHGPAGLLSGPQPYALILSDPDGLVLARNQDGPPLYYARSRGAVIVASEPIALLAAGIPAKPNESIIGRFLAVGACDEVPATFFDGIRRVLPGQIVEISRHTGSGGHADGWAIRAHPPAPNRAGRLSVRMALLGALSEERTGVVLLGAGQPDIALPTAALLGAALAERNTHRAVPVYSASMPEVSSAGPGYAAAVLGPIPDGAIRHRALPFFTDEIDVDGFVADLGEPIPSLSGYLLWALARATGGEVDALLAASGWKAAGGHLSRLSDRIAARYGIALRFPYRDLDGTADGIRLELQMLAERALPHASVRAAVNPAHGVEPSLLAVLQRLRPEIGTALLYPRHGGRDLTALTSLSRLPRAGNVELDRLWRHFVLERWLSVVVKPEAKATVPTARPPAESGQWQRHPVATEQLVAGDRLAEKVAWYVAEFVTAAAKPTRQAFRQPWYLVVAAKPVAVTQGRTKTVWEIEPGPLARALARAATGTRHADPWSMQVAVSESGPLRMMLATACARIGKTVWYDRIAGPAARAVSPPREHACAPGHLSVASAPLRPGEVAAEIVGALRRALPDEVFSTLGGCAIAGVDPGGTRVIGWSGVGGAPVGTLEKLCHGNPFGQGDERTPLLIGLAARGQAVQAGRKPGKKQPARRKA